MGSKGVVWFRNDLRIEDNPAFDDAMTRNDEVVALVVLDPRLLGSVGVFRRNQFLANVDALRKNVAELGGQLSIAHGDPKDIVPAVCLDADTLFFNEATSGFGRARDAEIESQVSCGTERYWGTLLTNPGSVLTGKGTLSKVFTAFSKVWFETVLPKRPISGSAAIVAADNIELASVPKYGAPTFAAGTAGAHEMLSNWLESVDDYQQTRDLPAVDGTSSMSGHLRFGTISPRLVFELVGTSTPGRHAFIRQLAWRDWYAHMLVENPAMLTSAVRAEYDNIAWREDEADLHAWEHGQTGYPIVDAGMRQLKNTGWMHNRVRMIVGSFLVKDLLIDWRHGEAWFRHLLIDAEPSQNAGNWQWVAGTGTDAAPYFRVFNPITQSRKFDPSGAYIRKWVPEIATLDDNAIHAPWELPPIDLAIQGVTLGDTYPAPIVDHGFARERALDAYKAARETR